MCDHGAAELRALARAEVDDAVRQANLFEQLHKLRGDRWCVDGGLQNYGIAADNGSGGHSSHDGEWEVPRWNYRTHAQRNVAQPVAFAGELDRRSCLVQPQRLASVELQKVDGFAHIGIGLAPVLADLKGQPGAELEAAFANESGGGEQQRCTLLHGHFAPASKGGLRSLHRLFDVLRPRPLVDPDDFSRMRRVHGKDFARGLQPSATDDDVVLAAQLGSNLGEGGLHPPLVFGLGEVNERLVDKRRQRR